MSDWIGTAVYIGGYLFTYRKMYLAVVTHMESESIGADSGDRVAAALITLLTSFIWPAVIVGWVVWRFLTPKTPGQIADELYEREQAVREREQHIARLERELGIGQDDTPRPMWGGNR